MRVRRRVCYGVGVVRAGACDWLEGLAIMLGGFVLNDFFASLI